MVDLLLCSFAEASYRGSRNNTCPPRWKGLTGICDRMEDECSIDAMCPVNEKCCFSGCQRLCTKAVGFAADVKPGVCPRPWKGADGICDRRGDSCEDDVTCEGSRKCCFNGCQKECVLPGDGSITSPVLGRSKLIKQWGELGSGVENRRDVR